MALSSPQAATARSSPRHRAGAPCTSARRQRRIAAASGAVLVAVIGVLAVWAHHSLSAAQPDSAQTAAAPPASALATSTMAPPMRAQLHAWLLETEPSINAVISTRDEIAVSAADDDIAATGMACRAADGAVTSLQHHLPSPDPALSAALQHAVDSYRLGLRHCLAGVQDHDADDIVRAAAYIDQANAHLRAAIDILERDLSDPRTPDGTDVRTI